MLLLKIQFLWMRQQGTGYVDPAFKTLGSTCPNDTASQTRYTEFSLFVPLCSIEISFITGRAQFPVGCIFKVLEADGQELLFSTHIKLQEALVSCPSHDPEKVGINQK